MSSKSLESNISGVRQKKLFACKTAFFKNSARARAACVLGVRVSRAHTFRTRRDRTLPLQVFFREKHQNDPKCYPNGFLTRKKNFVFGIFGVVEFFS